MEIWREVPGYGGWYECSTAGRVRSWRSPGNNQTGERPRAVEPALMNPCQTRGGYLHVTLSRAGKVRQYRINRLVLLTFEGDPEFEHLQACHRNGDRTDNRLENLYWGTVAENQADKERHGTQVRGERVASACLTREKVAEARGLWDAGGHTVLQLAERYGVSGPTIWRAVTRKTWKTNRGEEE